MDRGPRPTAQFEMAGDRAAREDWGWAPDHDADRAFDGYLVPAIARRYRGGSDGA